MKTDNTEPKQEDDQGVAAPAQPAVMRLCYVSGCFAYFTSKDLTEQWGDDWNDAPYEHNAGEPYGPCWHNNPVRRNSPESKRGYKPGTQTPLDVGEVCQNACCVNDWNADGTAKFKIEKMAFECELETPADLAGSNSAYSVEMINSGATAWLQTDRWADKKINIHAGVSMAEFKDLIEQSGGRVYLAA